MAYLCIMSVVWHSALVAAIMPVCLLITVWVYFELQKKAVSGKKEIEELGAKIALLEKKLGEVTTDIYTDIERVETSVSSVKSTLAIQSMGRID